jgi:hypothetical protein
MNPIPGTPAKLLTAILPKGVGRGILVALKRDKGIVSANLNYARGTGRMTHRAYHGARTTAIEKDVLSVVVPADRSEELFEFIYHEAGMDLPHGGILYQVDVGRVSEFVLPDLPDEDASG